MGVVLPRGAQTLQGALATVWRNRKKRPDNWLHEKFTRRLSRAYQLFADQWRRPQQRYSADKQRDLPGALSRDQRYTREISRGYLPPFGGRKWSANAVYEWRGGDVTPEYRRVLQEVRRLWQAQAWAKSAVVSHQTSMEFYRTLVREPLSK
jgi:hypothetical protein